MYALAIDPDYAPAHAQLGWIAIYGGDDLADAAEHFRHASARSSGSGRVAQQLGKAPEQLAKIKFDVTLPAALGQQPSESTPKAN